MAGAVRTVSVERGFDPREAALIAFGAAGPMHAVGIAEEIGIPEVVVPEFPGCHCAVGHVMADVVRDYVSTQLTPLDRDTAPALTAAFGALVSEAREELAGEGIAAQDQDFELGIDLRYIGQQASLTVPLPKAELADGGVDDVARTFHRLHEKLFGFAAQDTPLEAAAARLRAVGRLPRGDAAEHNGPPGDAGRPAPASERQVQFGPRPEDAARTAVYERETLLPGARLEGPAIVTQADATTLLPPGCRATVDALGRLRLKAG